MNAAERIERASVAVHAARIMSDPSKWCQGYWAIDDVGQPCSIEGAAEQAESEGLPGQAQADYIHWVQSNSPDARQFCIEGAIMHAAPSFHVGRAVIDQLNNITGRELSDTSYMGSAYPKSAQTLNDANGDASRVKLVQALLELADTLLNGNPEAIPEIDHDEPVPVAADPEPYIPPVAADPQDPFATPGVKLGS